MDLAERPRARALDTLLADVVVGNDDPEPHPGRVPAAARAAGEQQREQAEGGRPHRAKRLVECGLQLLGGRAAGPAAQHLPALPDEHDQARLAGGVVEPRPLVRHGDRMAEVELVGVLGSAVDVVLADDAEQPDRTVVRSHRFGRHAMDLLGSGRSSWR